MSHVDAVTQESKTVKFNFNKLEDDELMQVLILGMVSFYVSRNVKLKHTVFGYDDLTIRTAIAQLRTNTWYGDVAVTEDHVKDYPYAYSAFLYLKSLFENPEEIKQLRVKVYSHKPEAAQSPSNQEFSIAIVPGDVAKHPTIFGLTTADSIRDYQNIHLAVYGMLRYDPEVPHDYRNRPERVNPSVELWQNYIDPALSIGWESLPDYVQAAIAADAKKKADRQARAEKEFNETPGG